MNMRRIYPVCVIMLMAALFFAGCGQAPASRVEQKGITSKTTEIIPAANPEKLPAIAKNRKDTLVIGISTPEGVFNHLYSNSIQDAWINECLLGGLMSCDDMGQPLPGIIEKWDISPDGLEYVFHLRKDVKFWDGSPFTAEDIAFTFYVMADPAYDGQQDISSWTIKGVKAYQDNTADTIEGIQVVDPYTFKLVLAQPNATTVASIGSPRDFAVLSKAYYGKDYKKGNLDGLKALHRKPMGYGPYKLADYKEGIETILVANDNYWQGKPKLKNIIFKVQNDNTDLQLLSAGETDLAIITRVNARTVNQIRQAGFLTIQMYPLNGFAYIGLNFALNPAFKDLKVRQALAYGINRKQMTEGATDGYADLCNQPQSKVSAYYNPTLNNYDFNMEKANQLLDEAGWKKGADGIREKDGKKLQFVFTVNVPSPTTDVMVSVMKQNFEQLGIKFMPDLMEFQQVRKKVDTHQAEAWSMAWYINVDPDVSWMFNSATIQNRGKYSNPKLDELMDKALKVADPEERKKLYSEIYKMINEDLPYIFLWQRREMCVMNPRVQGFVVSPYKDFTQYLWQLELK